MPLINATILYPWDDEEPFDLRYYIDRHLPLSESVWRDHGLVEWSVTELCQRHDQKGLPSYRVQCVCLFESPSVQDVEAAFGEHVVAILHQDRARFTRSQTTPIVYFGEVKGRS